MNNILRKEVLTPEIKLFELECPLIAAKILPGQFVVIRSYEKGERIPLTVADVNKEHGSIIIIFQEVGKSTAYLGTLKKGDEIIDVIGPLGKPSEIKIFGTVVCIGGGVGIAPVYPIIKALKKKGNRIISILGARNKELLILENEIKKFSDELYITTDDGSYGKKGFVSDELKRLINEGRKIDRVVAIGPSIMMKVVAEVTGPYEIKTIVSLNPIMIDGTGMCGGCRVEIGGETKFACVDGPEFDGHLVNFDLLMKRQAIYLKEEEESFAKFKKEGV
ncbi:sulfide/dihydroorotate dehydrogenase-like FAD/NAD-binding protein [candidate division WOR-3 bacterium]|nr:sulfide/dihydroorotate dehydrogenase-like FAD/NAD-binding protein [candidate division WOR-3 bacterium]